MRRPNSASIVGMIAVAAAAFLACSIPRSPLEVVAWSPGTESAANGAIGAIGLSFSDECDRESVETAFSLTEDGATLEGAFAWTDGRTLAWTPAVPFREYRDYSLALGSTAHSTQNSNLDEDFKRSFTTRPERVRPGLVSVEPPDGSISEEFRPEVNLVFSEAIPERSFRASCSISPSVEGEWTSADSGITWDLSLAKDLENGKRYEIKIDQALSDVHNNPSGRTYVSTFTAGSDLSPPAVASLRAIDSAGASTLDLAWSSAGGAAAPSNSGWEADWGLEAEFDEPVKIEDAQSRLSVFPPLALKPRPEDSEYGATIRFEVAGRPAWGTRYSLRLARGVRDERGNASEFDAVSDLVADGPRSRPPRLIGMNFLSDGSAADKADWTWALYRLDQGASPAFSNLDLDPIYYPGDGSAVPVSVELYFLNAQGASIDPFELMSKVRFETTNACLSLSLRSLSLDDFDLAVPAIAGAQRAILRGSLANQAEAGLVTLVVSSGFMDSSGNPTEAETRLPLVK